MSNYTEQQSLHSFVIDKEQVNEATLVEVFDIDCDFSMNEEYFREDTHELGFQNESERCAGEIYQKHKEIKDPVERLRAMMKDVPEYNNGIQSFIVGNCNHSGDYQIEVLPVDSKIVIIIAYIG